MLDFLHDGEVVIKVLLQVDRPEDYCEEMTGLFHDLKEVHDRAVRIIEVRKVRGNTLLISRERYYLVYLILHTRADMTALFLRMAGSAEREDLLDTMTLGSFLQLRLYMGMDDPRRQMIEDAARSDTSRERLAEFRNGAPILGSRGQIITPEFLAKLDAHVNALDHRAETLVTEFMSRPVPSLGRAWFPLRRYATAPMREREWIGLDVAGANLTSFHGALTRLRGVLESECGLQAPVEPW
ncbi:MAG: hypothetical protein L0Z54_05870 [Thermoplasmata archaeon]|nr:hypothetical protein [Thermoplasmata archaeon]